MAENSAIEWTNHTFNPWVGCTKVGPGCDHCYAEGWAKRSGLVTWGANRRRTSVANWRQPLKWSSEAPKGSRPRVFCASLADVFDNEVPPEWRDDLFKMILQTQHLDWLLLTKRIGNVERMLPTIWNNQLPNNVWLGATMVNRLEMLRDASKLKEISASVHFWSVEPMLGDLGEIPRELMPDWVICGGESGGGARPMHPQWARNLRDQCVAAGAAFFFKQWGDWAPELGTGRHGSCPDFSRHHSWGDGWGAIRVGKKLAGRFLDGSAWDQFPRSAEPQPALQPE